MLKMSIGRCVIFLLNMRGYGYDYGCDCGGCGSCTACCGGGYNAGLSWANNSGLFNSCAFIVDMLNASGVGSRLIQIDGAEQVENQIKACQPTDVVIEAFFVPPSVLAYLSDKYPTVRWIIRAHSEIPFLAQDGNAMAWLAQYLALPAVSLAANTIRARSDLQRAVKSFFPHWDQPTLDHRVELLPNYYPTPAPLPRVPSPFRTLNVGCLGAIRPLKNQLLQAIAAIGLASDLGKKLLFHINSARVEGGVPAILTNIRNLFRYAVNADLVEHAWLVRDDFLDLCRRMDLGMQVSFSETYNIVTADFVTNNVPILVSSEITWADSRIQAVSTASGDMIQKAKIALRASSIADSNRAGLLAYNDASRNSWLAVFGQGATGWTDRPKSFVARPTITSSATHM